MLTVYPPTASAATPSEPCWIGVDVGGSKVAVLVADEGGRVLAQVNYPTVLSSPSDTVAGIVATIRHAVKRAGVPWAAIGGVGLGVPGRVDPQTGVVRRAVNLHWDELAVGDLLAEALGRPCALENDVRLATIGLQAHPAYAGRASLAYVSVGTGIAAGLILGGHLYRGSHGMAGEIGHMIVEKDGPRCACGQRGCLEALAAGPAIARQGAAALRMGTPTTIGQAPTAAHVYAAAAAGDMLAGSIVTQTGALLARALAALVLAYDVEEIVLGGGVARAGATFLNPILDELARLRAVSPLAAEMLPPERFTLGPPDYAAALWGGIALARQARPAVVAERM